MRSIGLKLGLTALQSMFNFGRLPGMQALWKMDEGSGSFVYNDLFPRVTPTNLFAATEGAFDSTNSMGATTIWSTSSWTLTDLYPSDTDPQGNHNATRLQCTVGANAFLYLNGGVTFAAVPYTLSIWVKSNTGASQTFLMSWGVGTHPSPIFTATTSWQRFTWTFTPTAGANGLIVCWSNGTTATATDLLVWGADLNLGSSAGTYNSPNDWMLTLGQGLAVNATAAQTWTATGLDIPTTQMGVAGHVVNPVTFSQISVYAAVKWSRTPQQAGSAPILNGVPGGSDTTLAFAASMASNKWPHFSLSGTQLNAYSSDLNDGVYHVLAATYDGSYMRIYLDGCEIMESQSPVSLSPITLSWLLLGCVGNTAFWPGEFGYLAVASQGHTKAQVQDTTAYIRGVMQSRGAAPANPQTLVYFEGDSITVGAGTTTNYPYEANVLFSARLPANNFAVGGTKVADMAARFAALSASVNKSVPKRILHILDGTNDMLGSATPASLYASIKAYAAAAKPTFTHVVLGTMLPAQAVGFNAKRNAYNALIYAEPSPPWDAIDDFAADPTMGPDSASADSTLYYDGEHPTALGHQKLGVIAHATINALL